MVKCVGVFCWGGLGCELHPATAPSFDGEPPFAEGGVAVVLLSANVLTDRSSPPEGASQ